MLKMFLFLMISLLLLEFNDSKQLSRTKREGNPETFMNISEVLQYHGYPNEEHEILTNDGYFLTINRILGRKASEETASKPVVLLMPGILTDCGIWLTNLPNGSLGFILADAGFDVWLANNRGSRWCKRHQNFSHREEEFWNFSFHEMAMEDLPAIIYFILAKTRQKQLFYVGYSQGSTIGFIAFSAMPALAEKIKIFFAFGPIYLVNHIKPWYKMIIDMNPVIIKATLGRKEICLLPNHITRKLTTKFCYMDLWRKTCANILLSGGEISENNVNMSRLDVIVSHLFGCTSAKTLLHWKQMYDTGEFKEFDYGSKNMEKYNQMTPPFYDIRSMNIPTFMWSGEKDKISTLKDTELFLPLLSNLISYKIIPHWMHYDYLFGLDARQKLYDELVDIIHNFP
ncbi:lipase member M-like [Ahaetulla prasina]|uniref:lipase member M-like n=1 Tax=Ahaetulla prasina TaxID=499056 RepID=UPI002648A081|nr:lipase member M-like [Ahaetulla prasina]XP_058043759.1 lipase member M-like [Ahaetulla prasina]XP_058043760.1 lipase member M-like [Ahaetulla prasina]XP_058043761.1 lipase member M-like [Ahaetulla prasina]